MTIFTLILVFILNNQLIVEQKVYQTLAECVAAGNTRIEEQSKDPKFERGLFADCIELPGQLVTK